MAKCLFRRISEEEAGKFPYFLLYAVLEWVLIILLFVDGFLAFFANEFANFFGLRAPCLFCTRIDHILVHRDRDFYFNASLCPSHKKEVSSLAYCHNHRKVSDIRRMCEACLLSFATEKQALDCDTYKSLVGILQKDLECFVDDDDDDLHFAAAADEGSEAADHRCSCCGDGLRKRARSPSRHHKGRLGAAPALAAALGQAPAPSPRAARLSIRRRGSEIRVLSENELEASGDGVISSDKLREDVKAAMVPLLTKESEEANDGTNKTPTMGSRGNRFFGIPLSDSATSSPRVGSRLSRKSPAPVADGGDTSIDNIDSILIGLKKQVRLDRKSLMALYIELDEERSASAVAANNAMAMITRLQAEKAAMQMEALQYQRMMEEQFEYDQEALQETNELLLKREEDVRVLEAELQSYKDKFGSLKPDCDDGDSVRTEIGSSCLSLFSEEEANNGDLYRESLKDFKEEKTYILARRKMDKKEGLSENNGVDSSDNNGAGDEIDTSST